MFAVCLVVGSRRGNFSTGRETGSTTTGVEGIVLGDYVMWIVTGIALFGISLFLVVSLGGPLPH